MAKQNKNPRILFFAGIVLLSIFLIFSYLKINSLIDSAAWVNHTTRVTLELEKAISNLKDVQSGYRGYLLTRDKIFIERFSKGLTGYPKNFAAVKQLTLDNPEQQKSLILVQLIAEHNQAYLKKMLAVKKVRALTTAEFYRGKIIMDSLRSAINTMINREKAFLKIREKQFDSQALVAPVMLLLVSLLALVLLIISFWLLNKEVARSRQFKSEIIKQAVEIEKSNEREQGEKRFCDILKNAPVAIVVLRGEDFVVEWANDKQLKTWGKTEGQVKNLPVFTAISELKGQGFKEILTGVLTTGKPYTANEIPAKLIRNGKSETLYFNLTYEPLYEKDTILGIISIATEITEQVNARRLVEDHAAKFNALADNIPNLAWMADAQGWIYWYNRKWYDYTGTTPEQMEGWGWQSVHDPEKLPAVMERWQGSIESGQPFEMTFPLKAADGKYGQFLTRVSPIRDNEGNIQQWFGTNTDVTEQMEIQEQLKQSEERLLTTINASGLGLWDFDVLNEKVIAGGNMAKIYGFDSNQHHTVDAAFAAMHPDDREEQERIYAGLFAGTKDNHFITEFRIINQRTKAIRWIKGEGTAFYDNQGALYRMAGTNADITEQKETQDRLKESEQRFRALVDNMPLVCFMINPTSEVSVSYWNKTWLDYTGQSSEEALGRAWEGIMHPDDVQGAVNIFLTAFEKQQPYFVPATRVRRKDGIFRWHSWRANPRFLITGEFLGYVGVGIDIHDQKLAEDALKEREEKFRSLVQSLPQLVWVTDAAGNSEFSSYRWKEYTGIEPAGEETWKAIVHPDDYDGINAAWVQSLITGNTYKSDVRLKSKTGEYRWHTVKGEPILDKENIIIKWVGAFTDIQDRKLIEEKQDEFISIASHELKTPLTTVKAYLQILELSLDKNSTDSNHLYAKKASESVGRLNKLIGELLDVSKIRLGKLNYTITTFNFGEMINSTVENMQLTSLTHTIIKSSNVYDEVTGDKDRLQQVVINLLTNAIKYSPGKHTVFITVEQINEDIKVSVKDNGIGMSDESLKIIFDKYHRLEEHAMHFQGLGIGLFISHEIIDRHHGKLWAESEIGNGSTFYFTIPINSALQ